MAELPNININNIGDAISGAIPQTIFGLQWFVVLNILAGIFIIMVALWYFMKRGRLKYHIQIFERDAGGIPIPMDTDILNEKIINKGKNTVYLLSKYQALAHPPVSKFIYKRTKGFFRSELWCDYLRERQDFIPMQRLLSSGLNSQMDIAVFTKRLLEIYESTPADIKQKYIYSPIIPDAIAHLKYEPMDYNMTEMLQVRLSQRELLYADRQGFMQTYGPTIGLGLAAVCIIVVAFLSFNYASHSIKDTTAAANAVAEKLGGVIASLQNSQLQGN